jgi:hypothetical protein
MNFIQWCGMCVNAVVGDLVVHMHPTIARARLCHTKRLKREVLHPLYGKRYPTLRIDDVVGQGGILPDSRFRENVLAGDGQP